MTEDQIIAEATRLGRDALLEGNILNSQAYGEAVARHALRLAKEPEQDPQLVKEMAVFREAYVAWGNDASSSDNETAARVIMKHYGLPVEVVEWAKMIAPICPHSGGVDSGTVARFILKMAGEAE